MIEHQAVLGSRVPEDRDVTSMPGYRGDLLVTRSSCRNCEPSRGLHPAGINVTEQWVAYLNHLNHATNLTAVPVACFNGQAWVRLVNSLTQPAAGFKQPAKGPAKGPDHSRPGEWPPGSRTKYNEVLGNMEAVAWYFSFLYADGAPGSIEAKYLPKEDFCQKWIYMMITYKEVRKAGEPGERDYSGMVKRATEYAAKTIRENIAKFCPWGNCPIPTVPEMVGSDWDEVSLPDTREILREARLLYRYQCFSD